jgi:DNA glycosylase AlkZ-like
MRIPRLRLDRQLISRPRFAAPEDVVGWFGAIQAQDYLAALWALGLRTPGATEGNIEAAVTSGAVIRTHLFRGTLQFVAREDVRWMLALVGPRIIAAGASRNRQLGLDEAMLHRATGILAQALAGGRRLTRRELRDLLAAARIPVDTPRLTHLLGHAELAGVLCGAGRRSKEATFASLDDRVPEHRPLTRDQSLAELARRYFQSRGPATVRDLAWWSGLTMEDSRTAVELAEDALASLRIEKETYWIARPDGSLSASRSTKAHLLPAFDEYLVGYRDRSAQVDAAHVRKVNAGGGMLSPVVVIEGRVAATWTRAIRKDEVAIGVHPVRKLIGRDRRALGVAAERYASFLGLAPRLRL